jgi:hypothetical protein
MMPDFSFLRYSYYMSIVSESGHVAVVKRKEGSICNQLGVYKERKYTFRVYFAGCAPFKKKKKRESENYI